MANEEEEDFFDELEDYEEPAPAPQQRRPAPAPAPAPVQQGRGRPRLQQPQSVQPQQSQPRPQPQPQQSQPQSVQVPVQQAAAAPQSVDRYVPFILPQRVGMFDQTTGQPVIEDPEKLDLMIGLLVGLHNKLERIEQRL